jgi:hypothetical protein
MRDEELIDRVAKDMTRGDPTPHLRHAVRALIAPAPSGLAPGRPGLATRARRPWIPVTAVAAVVLSIIVARTLSDSRV